LGDHEVPSLKSKFLIWRLRIDEVFVSVNGETRYRWHAVNHEVEFNEAFVTKRRDRHLDSRKILTKAVPPLWTNGAIYRLEFLMT